jgi:hypothetical protein
MIVDPMGRCLHQPARVRHRRIRAWKGWGAHSLQTRYGEVKYFIQLFKGRLQNVIFHLPRNQRLKCRQIIE